MVGQKILRVAWRIGADEAPRVRRHCRRCDAAQAFSCSGRFRTNLQKKRLDVWLIYRCAACGETWNLPVLERGFRQDLAPGLFEAMCRNDRELALAYASDVDRLGAHADAVEPGGEVRIVKTVDGPVVPEPAVLAIGIVPSGRPGVRLDRLLARELGLPRADIRRMARDGSLSVEPGGAGALRREVRSEVNVVVALGGLAPAPAAALAAAALQGGVASCGW